MDRSLLNVTATMLLAAALPAAVAAQGRSNPAVGFSLGSRDVAVETAGDSQTMPATLYVAMARSLAHDTVELPRFRGQFDVWSSGGSLMPPFVV